MNRFTLKFTNLEQEAIYAEYLLASQKPRVQYCFLAITLISLAISVHEFIQWNLQIAVIYAGFSLISMATWMAFQKYSSFRKHYLLLLIAMSFTFPYVSLYIITMSEELSLVDKMFILMIHNLTLQYCQVYQNFLVSVVVEINKIIMYGVSLFLMFGPNIYLLIFVVYSMFWLTIEFQTQKDKRQKFQAAQINQSLWGIIDKSVKNKIISFTFDEDNLKFDLELCNQAAKSYLIEDQQVEQINLSHILRNIFIHADFKLYNLGNYISQKFILNQQGIQANYQKFKGFYENTRNKIKLRLYIQQVPKLKFILNIQSYSKQETLKQGQGWLISKYEVMTVKIINRIANVIQKEKQLNNSSFLIKSVLNTYQAKLKLLNVLYSSNYQLTLKEFDIVEQLCTLFQHSLINYTSNLTTMAVTTDYSLTKLLFQLVIKYIGIVGNQQMRVAIEFEQKSQDRIAIMFKFKGILLMNNNSFTKLFDAIDKLIQIVGIRNSLEHLNHGITFDLVTTLDSKFN